MRYPPNLLEEILRRTDIVQLVGRRVKLTRKGRVFWGCCPFHGEKTPSFKVENERRTFKCFGCGKGGDSFRWMMEIEGLTFPEAVEKLAGEAGVELPKWSAEDEAREEKRKSLYDVIELACQFYQDQLFAREGQEARTYLKSRGLDEAAAKKFRLGYAPKNSALIEHLKTKNITQDQMIAAGLARPSENDRPMRDFFYDRLMFPIADSRGRIVAFGGRGLSADAKPKYINTGETMLFSKGQMLYNFHAARASAIKESRIIIAEGYMDVIALVRAGFEAAVAPLGTALTEDQLQLLWRTAPEPILSFDGDEAGLRAASRAARLALPHLKPGHSLRFVFLPNGEDPDSLIQREGPIAMGRLLEKAEPLSTVLWRMETDGKDFSTPERRAGLERSLGEIVSAIGDSKIADYYKRDFDEKIFENFKKRAPAAKADYRPGRSEGRGDFRPARNGQGAGGRGPFRAPLETVSPAVKASLLARAGKSGARQVRELELARLVFAVPEIAVRHGEMLAELPFSDRQLDRLRHEILHLAASGSGLERQGLENHLVRQGLADLVARLTGPHAGSGPDASGGAEFEEMEARFLRAAADLREKAELAPERTRAVERFNLEPSEDNWAGFLRGKTNS